MYAIGNCALCLPMVDRTAIWVLTFSAPIPYGKEKETRASSCRFIFDIFSLPARRHRRTDAQSFALLASSTDQPNLLPRSSEPHCGYADSWNGCTEGRRVLSYDNVVGPDYDSYYAFAPSTPFLRLVICLAALGSTRSDSCLQSVTLTRLPTPDLLPALLQAFSSSHALVPGAPAIPAITVC